MPTPLTSSPTTIFTESGLTTIDGLLSEDRQKWGNGSDSAVLLSYSFPWSDSEDAIWQADYSDMLEQKAAQHFALNAEQIASVSSALQSWSDVANIVLTQVADTASSVGDFRLAFSSVVTDSWGWCYYPDNYWASAGDVWINPAFATEGAWSTGSYNYYSLVHEAGHGLGLKHPGNYFGGEGTGLYLPESLDFRNYSVMSYNDWKYWYLDTRQNPEQYIGVVPSTPMVYDIAAIQYLYGANISYQSGDNTYTFDPSTPFYKSIWDAGGIDTIDISNFSTDCTINLTAGRYSSIYFFNSASAAPDLYDGSNNLGIAFGVSIENAKGGSGNDTITGNSLANTFTGGGGDDTLNGGNGLDIAVFSGISSDYTITYDAGAGIYAITDTRVGGDGADYLSGVEQFQFADTTRENSYSPTVTLFSPNDGAVNVAVMDDIVITFNEVIQRGSGSVSIFSDSSSGRIFLETPYDISTSASLTISENTLTINPTAPLAYSTHYSVSLDGGLVKDSDENSYAGNQTYDFTTANPYVDTPSANSGSGVVGVVAGVASIGIFAWLIL
ncbi:MAG: hypothetical protein HGB23_03860 [Chlorobiaceae bacterium]|nr:hypothetical protein [Chlorobiaceae bacterium]